MKRSFKIWAVSEGPFSVEELIYDEGYEFDIPEEGQYLVVCKVEEDKKLRDEEFWFTDRQDAYNFKNFVDSKMEAIEVVDEGPGIPEEQLKKITKAFVRIPGSKESGFGLGLSICNKVMVAHGGSLKIKIVPGGGACFALHFPLDK